jgi:SAM-dependent methyltransferase
MFRTLIPGGGTDGGTSFIAEQLNHTNSETVYLDFSKTSMLIAQKRAKMRNLNSLIWIIDWIENLPLLGLGNFQLVLCSGVLHHLKNPEKGLKITNDMQSTDGGADVMVYGKYGRTGVYILQTVLSIINKKERSLAGELKNAKAILKALSEDHWLSPNSFGDLVEMTDSGIYDLLLHKRDVSFSVTEVYEWTEKSGYTFVDYSEPDQRLAISLRNKISEETLYNKAIKMGIPKQRSIGEILYGNIIKQDIYLSKRYSSEASLEDNQNLIFINGSPFKFPSVIEDKDNYVQLRNKTFLDAQLAHCNADLLHEGSDSYLNIEHGLPFGFTVPSTDLGSIILPLLVKKSVMPKSFHSFISYAMKKYKINATRRDEMEASFNEIFTYLKEAGLLILKKETVGSFPTTCCASQYVVLNRHE